MDSVSASIEATPFVAKACAIFSDKVLWGFYSGPHYVEEAIVKSVVEKRQPYYAVPSKFVFQETLPMTPNGKIDKRALLASVGNTPASPPTTPDITKPAAAVVPSEKQTQVVVVPPSTSSSSSFSDSDYLEKFTLPEKRGRHGLRALRHRIFSLYRRLFSVVFIVNVVAICLMISFSKTGNGLKNISTAVAANLTMAVLMRQEYVINSLFTVACAVPTSWPMWIRRNCAKVYHIGGLHSGCAIASVVWFTIFTVGM